jgi:ABC-type dipeptide/oligopeptide/nickel transport system permease component
MTQVFEAFTGATIIYIIINIIVDITYALVDPRIRHS